MPNPLHLFESFDATGQDVRLICEKNIHFSIAREEFTEALEAALAEGFTQVGQGNLDVLPTGEYVHSAILTRPANLKELKKLEHDVWRDQLLSQIKVDINTPDHKLAEILTRITEKYLEMMTDPAVASLVFEGTFNGFNLEETTLLAQQGFFDKDCCEKCDTCCRVNCEHLECEYPECDCAEIFSEEIDCCNPEAGIPCACTTFDPTEQEFSQAFASDQMLEAFDMILDAMKGPNALYAAHTR